MWLSLVAWPRLTRASSRWKRLLGPVAIAFFVLKRLTDKRVVQPIKAARITFDPTPGSGSSSNGGAKDCSLMTDLLMLVAANSRQMGRTVAAAPGALLDDGLLDFTLMTGSSLTAQTAALAATVVSSSDSAASSGISQLRASRLEVVSGEAGDLMPVNRDGEPEESASRLVFQVLTRVLPMHLPDDRLLVSGQRDGSGGSAIVTGQVKSARYDSFVPMAQAVSALAAGKGKKVRLGGRLTAATLRHMMAAVAAPAGAHVRRRANAKAIAARLARYGVLVAAGSVAGWVVGRRGDVAVEQAA